MYQIECTLGVLSLLHTRDSIDEKWKVTEEALISRLVPLNVKPLRNISLNEEDTNDNEGGGDVSSSDDVYPLHRCL